MTCEFILKRILLSCLSRHQLLPDDELGPLYDLLIDEPPMIRRAIGELVYDHLIAQEGKNSQLGLHYILFRNWPYGVFFFFFWLLGQFNSRFIDMPIIYPGGDDESSEVHLGRMLQILREFPDDPILSAYVIDDVWDDMKAMKVYI